MEASKVECDEASTYVEAGLKVVRGFRPFFVVSSYAIKNI